MVQYRVEYQLRWVRYNKLKRLINKIYNNNILETILSMILISFKIKTMIMISNNNNNINKDNNKINRNLFH
jgi:hypothetical protein